MTGAAAPVRVVVVTSPPTPYRDPLFARIARDPSIALQVFYAGAAEKTRPWDLPASRPFAHRFLRGRSLRLGVTDRHEWLVSTEVLRRLKAARPDVVVIWGWFQPSSALAIAWCRARHVPYVLFAESHRPGSGSRLRRALRGAVATRAVRGASAWLATGTLARRLLVGYGAREDGVFPFPNGPDVAALAARAEGARTRRAEVRASFGLPPTAPVVGFVGRFVPKKGQPVLHTAIIRVLAPGHPPPHQQQGAGPAPPPPPRGGAGGGGGGPPRRPPPPLAPRVGFAGFAQPDAVHEAYVASDVLAVPSLAEPWGVVVLESLSCGTPVVVSDAVGCAPDLVPDACVVPAGDSAALADALSRVLSSPDRGRAGGGGGAARAAAGPAAPAGAPGAPPPPAGGGGGAPPGRARAAGFDHPASAASFRRAVDFARRAHAEVAS